MSTLTLSSSGPQPIVIDGISYIPSSVLLTGIPKLSIKDNRAFAVVDSMGQVPRIYAPASELGLFYNDTRYLGVWEMTINGEAPVALTSDLHRNGNALVVSMTNRDFERIGAPGARGGRVPRDTLLVRRILGLLDDQLFEALEIKNFDSEPLALQIEVWSGGRFDDVFEVRGFLRKARGRMLPVEEIRASDSLTTIHQYEGLDQALRRTYIRRYFPLEKIRASPALAGYFARITIPAKETVSLRTLVGFDRPPDPELLGENFARVSTPRMMQILSSRRDKEPAAKLRFECDNAIVTRALNSAMTDIYMLLTREEELVYPYAGIPWFSAPFGRDGIIAAYQMLPWSPWVAKGVLSYVFRHLGNEVDTFTDEEPGKVFHEMRRGEMSRTREVPFIPYYGSVDATPLALILLHEYVRWTRDLEGLREWWPAALKALEWMEKWGDARKTGFLEYARRSPTGLANQGWKDSSDSVMHVDGLLAAPPISLCEVQGYAFRARLAISELARLMGEEHLSNRVRADALRLRSRFSEYFWDGERQIVALALDGEGKPCRVRSSNMGHCLWSEILTPQQASEVSRHLMSEAMFSGYGIRTLADTEISYNPMSYHNGSVWPHDNSIIMEGLRKYRLSRELERLSSAMIDVIESSDDFRLPELFCGFRRRGDAPPVPYQVACKPQAWSAGSLFLMLKSMLGLTTDPHEGYVVFNSPVLSEKINWLEIHGLCCRDWELNLGFRRTQAGVVVEVLRRSGSVRVLTVR